MTAQSTDNLRQAVYRAEDQWSATMDRGGHADFFGSSITIPAQIRFGNLADVQTYVDAVCRAHDLPTVRVRHRQGATRAHYEVKEQMRVIAVPTDRAWAMRESVVLHEISHHGCHIRHDTMRHDAQFATTMLELVRGQLGHEAELLLRTGYQAAGVTL